MTISSMPRHYYGELASRINDRVPGLPPGNIRIPIRLRVLTSSTPFYLLWAIHNLELSPFDLWFQSFTSTSRSLDCHFYISKSIPALLL